MNAYQRTVFIALLIPFAFGLLTLIETGGFILPFPLNELIFAIVALIFFMSNIRSKTLIAVSSTLFALINIFSTEFLWSFFASQDQIANLDQEGVFDTIRFLSYVVLFIWGGITLLRNTNLMKVLAYSTMFISFMIGIFMQYYALMIFTTIIPYLLSFKHDDLKPYHLLWLMLSILNAITLSMFYFSK